MLQEVYCVARTDHQAHEIIEKIKKMGIAPDAFTVVRKPEEVYCAAYRVSEEARKAANGAIVGVIIGLLFGTAVFSAMGVAGLPELFQAMLFLACAALGGAIFGTIVGSSGFAKKRSSIALERHFEEEIREGGKLISIQIHNSDERERLIGTINALDVADIHYSDEQAA